MSKEQFSDNCDGCRPILIEPETMSLMKPDSKEMQIVDRIWAATTYWERKAFHEFMCLNSREPDVVKIVENLNGRLTAALEADANKTKGTSETQ